MATLTGGLVDEIKQKSAVWECTTCSHHTFVPLEPCGLPNCLHVLPRIPLPGSCLLGQVAAPTGLRPPSRVSSQLLPPDVPFLPPQLGSLWVGAGLSGSPDLSFVLPPLLPLVCVELQVRDSPNLLFPVVIT